jgi:hypothetical protein
MAFPSLTNWQYQNEVNEVNSEYLGFSMWGEFVLNPDAIAVKRFFVTLDIYRRQWRGNLTIGQHAYFWSSTEEGDSYLLNTEPYDSLRTAISALKTEIERLFNALVVRE